MSVLFVSLIIMDALLHKMQKSAAIAEVKSIDTLVQQQPYKILKFVQSNTKFGPSIQVYLENPVVHRDAEEKEEETGDDDDCLVVYLPGRIAADISQQDIESYNNGRTKTINLVYYGRVGRTFDVRFA